MDTKTAMTADTPTPFNLSVSNVTGKKKNTQYPHRLTIRNGQEMASAAEFDYTDAKFKDNHRQDANFIEADAATFDIDNDDSDTPADWVTPETLRRDYLPTTEFWITYSRNHNTQKEGKAARPKYHVTFPFGATINDVTKYRTIKQAIAKHFPHDPNAVDAARFFFGVKDAAAPVYFPGASILDTVDTTESAATADTSTGDAGHGDGGSIDKGSRNKTLSAEALKLLKRYGNAPEARERYEARAGQCVPPLNRAEINYIWTQATRNAEKKVWSKPNYIPPKDFEKTMTATTEDFEDLTTAPPPTESINEYRDTKSDAAYVDAFIKDSETASEQETLSTNFNKLDKCLGGGIFDGLITIGAMSGAGKTAIVQQLAAAIAQQGRDVLFVGLEMNRRDLMARHFSRESCLISMNENNGEPNVQTARTARDFLTFRNLAGQKIDGKRRDVMNTATKTFSYYARYIHTTGRAYGVHTAANIVDAATELYTRIATPPVIIVDYLQYITGDNERDTDKQRVSKSVMAMKALADGAATDGKPTTVICVSSINRNSYNDSITFASFKESGEIEYTSEVLIGLEDETETVEGKTEIKQYSGNWKIDTIRHIKLKILKQRYGDRNLDIPFLFLPAYSLFVET